MDAAPEPVAEEVLDDLRRRLRDTRHLALPRGVGWERGTSAEFLAELVGHWAEVYDWRPNEERIRALPWRAVSSPPGRVVHQRAAGGAATAVVLLHGWPDSVLRFERLLPLLGDLDVVVPALPGYPFAPPLTEAGMSTTAMAAIVAGWMAELGYERYVVSGGDIGSSVAEAIASAHPERVAAMHLTEVTYRHEAAAAAGDPAGLGAEELDFLAALRAWLAAEGAYAHEQATKPHSLAPALGDSPAGLAAWLLEKLRRWSDCDGEVEAVFAREDLLTWITAYWVTGTIGTSFSPYFEPDAPVGPVTAPTVVTIFPHDLLRPPRAFGERFFDVRRWDEPAAGGHFGAWEQPEAYAESLRAAVALAEGAGSTAV